MIDFSDTLKGKDIVWEQTSQFKIRNILKTSVAENPYYPAGGTDLSEFYKNETSNARRLSCSISKTLFEQHCDLSQLILKDKNGIFDVSVLAPTKEGL